VGNSLDPISDEEIVYRRIPATWYPDQTRVINDQAFAPHKHNDHDGLSVSRAKFNDPEDATKRVASGKKFFLARLSVHDLKKIGLSVIPAPLDNDPGHAVIPEINASNRGEKLTLERQRQLVQLCMDVIGPIE